MQKKIEITDAGPIEGTFFIDLSHGPGVYEFRGSRGTGKTTCISSIDWLAGHKVDVTMHDGALSGKVEGFGVVAPIGGKKRRKGKFELDTIDAEKFSITDILDPQGKTPEVRDGIRIKAIVSLSGVTAEPSLYYELTGGQDGYEALGIQQTDDPVQLATRVKQAFESDARHRERVAEQEAAHAIPLEYVPEEVDITASCNIEELSQQRDVARDRLGALVNEREDGIRRDKEASLARKRLAELRNGYHGPTLEAAKQQHEAATDKYHSARRDVERLKRELEAAQREAIKAAETCAATTSVLEAAESHASAIEQLTAMVEVDVREYPGEDVIEDARDNVVAATEAYQAGIRVADTLKRLEQAKHHRQMEQEARAAAEEDRNRAAAVFDVLATSLSLENLEVKPVDGAPRLFVQHPKRGRTAFDQVNGLSDGERVEFTLKELLPHLEPPGMLPIPQRVYQDLQPSDRVNLHRLARDRGLYVFGAQVTDGDLQVVYVGDEDGGER